MGLDLAIKFLLSLVLGGLLGWERESDRANDTEANRTQQFRETAFKRVSRGSAKSELPVNLSSSGLI